MSGSISMWHTFTRLLWDSCFCTRSTDTKSVSPPLIDGVESRREMWNCKLSLVLFESRVPGGSDGKKSAAVRETQVHSLRWEDPLEKRMATHSSTLAWRILWTEDSGGLQSTGSQRVRHDWTNYLFQCSHFESKVQPLNRHQWSYSYLICHLVSTLILN